MKLLKENIEKKLHDIGLGDDLVESTPMAQARKAKTDKWDYIKLKSFRTAEETTKAKRQSAKWAKTFANHVFDKGVDFHHL